jgi:hypothetical protein
MDVHVPEARDQILVARIYRSRSFGYFHCVDSVHSLDAISHDDYPMCRAKLAVFDIDDRYSIEYEGGHYCRLLGACCDHDGLGQDECSHSTRQHQHS